MTQPAESESSNANNAETERQASVQRLTMARIFSMRRSNTMRRTQSDSLAAEHTYRTRSARRAARAAQASSDAAATMGCKREYGTASPHGQYSQESHGQNRHSPHGCDGSSPHGHSSDAAHAAVLQHEHSRLSTPQQSVDPNTDVFQLFDAGMLTPQGVDHRSRGSRAVTDAQVGNDV